MKNLTATSATEHMSTLSLRLHSNVTSHSNHCLHASVLSFAIMMRVGVPRSAPPFHHELLDLFSSHPSTSLQFSSVQSLSHVWLFATLWIAARQASLSITNSRSSLRLTSIESVMASSHLILCHPLLLLPPIPPSIRVFSIESTLRTRWPKYWSFSFSIIPSKEHPGLISFRLRWCVLSVEWEEEQKSVNKRVAKAETALCGSKTSQIVNAIFPQLNAVFP